MDKEFNPTIHEVAKGAGSTVLRYQPNDEAEPLFVELRVKGKKVEVYVHNEERCSKPGGCQPLYSANLGNPEPETQSSPSLIDTLSMIFGNTAVVIMDENGVRHPDGAKLKDFPFTPYKAKPKSKGNADDKN